MTVAIDLPMTSHIRDMELDMSTDSLHLNVPFEDPAQGGPYELTVPLPQPIDADGVKAKFRRRRRQLSISAPVLG